MNMDKLLKEAKKMHEQMNKIQENLSKNTIEGKAGGGAVVIKIDGNGEILALTISPEVVNPNDIEMLEDLVITALKDAFKKKEEISSANMSSITEKLGNFPGWI